MAITSIAQVSIHTPTKGVTRVQYHLIGNDRFQSTHPRRVWLSTVALGTSFNKVSIHTPTKGVTSATVKRVPSLMFQSTHPRRVWLRIKRMRSTSPWFQSTHPRRVWLSLRLLIKKHWKFQSTHPRRVWLNKHYRWFANKDVSIHTPTKGVTCGLCDLQKVRYVSIHTPTKGVTAIISIFIDA